MLALRIGKAIKTRTKDSILDYYGPPEWAELVDRESSQSGEQLINDAQRLMNSIGDQGFEPQRATYLTKQLQAFETVCRRLNDEIFAMNDEVSLLFDIDVNWIPETTFEQAYTMYDEALPGHGSIAARLQQWKERYQLPTEKIGLLPELVQMAVMESRQRMRAYIDLPESEKIEVQTFTDKPFRALAHYQGNYHSRILINTSIPFNMADLLYVVCHEGYPGHLAEYVLKEEYLVKKKGYFEQNVSFLLSPSFVISEGLALLAHELVFPSDEAEKWLSEQIYPKVGIQPDTTKLRMVQRANDLLMGVRCNAAFLLREGKPEHEIISYLMKYALLDHKQALLQLQSLKRPFCEAYIFTYFYGRQLLQPLLGGPRKHAILRRLLTEQVTPSQLSMIE